MDITEKFKKGVESRTYQRIDPSYRVNIFVGYNDDGRMSMVITEQGKPEKVKSSKYIDVRMLRRVDGKIALSFDLLDSSFEPMFVFFCRDMISICEQAGKELAIPNAVLRWQYWREMFGRSRQDLLSQMEIKGLIGELLVLRDFMIPKFGTANAVQSWMGPLLGHKDFEIDDTWYEVKAVSQGAVQVSISSVEQLESDVFGHLMIVRLEETNGSNSRAVTLNSIVIELSDIIGEDPFLLDIFRDRLNSAGYNGESEYDNFCFAFSGLEKYRVDDSFPRIRRENLHSSIGNAQYTILLNGISDFRED